MSFWHGHDWKVRVTGKHVATVMMQQMGKLTAVITRDNKHDYNLGNSNEKPKLSVQLAWGCIVKLRTDGSKLKVYIAI